MSKPEQVLVITPDNELRFRGPFKDVVSANLKLLNPTDRRVCFKVKTTAPKRYCVRPNSGIIDPQKDVTVQVMLQPFEYDPNEKNKHKFMVQSLFAPDGNLDSTEALWKTAAPDQLMDSKLKCVFELPIDSSQNNLDVSNASVDDNNTTNVTKQPTPDRQTSPVMSTPKANNVESEVKKIADECQRLQSEMRELRHENSKLKEEGVRLRKLAVSDSVSTTTPASSRRAEEKQGELSLSSLFQMPHILFLVIAITLGLILGKIML